MQHYEMRWFFFLFGLIFYIPVKKGCCQLQVEVCALSTGFKIP